MSEIVVPSFLVIRSANIGDLVCTTPLIHALRERYPKSRLCALVNSYNRAVLDNNPGIDTVYAYMKAKHREPGQGVLGVYWKRMRLMHELRRQRFDYAIIGGAHFLPHALRLARTVKPRHIIGFTEPGQRGVKHIDMGVPYTLPHPMHETQDIFRVLAPLGITSEPPPMRMYPDPVEVEAARHRLTRQRVPVGKMLIGVQISSRKPVNRWSVENFIKLIRQLHATYGAAFLLLWSPGRSDNPRHPGDDDDAAAIAAALAGLPVIANPQGPLPELIADLSLCDVVITCDGGALHIAAALGKPTLCFFGSTDAARWRPWGVPHILLQPPSRKATDISTNEAFLGFQSLLAACGQSLDRVRPGVTTQSVP